MLISLIIFSTSSLGIIAFLIWKAPAVEDLSEEDRGKDFIVAAKEKIGEEVKKEVSERFEDLLQKILSNIRKAVVGIEKITTKWLYTLKRRRKKKGDDS